MAPRCCCSRNNYVVEKQNRMILELYLCLGPQTQIGKKLFIMLAELSVANSSAEGW